MSGFIRPLQSVRINTEVARSAWYRLKNENDSLIKRVRRLPASLPQTQMLEFLQDHQEHLKSCISDAVAMAEDVDANVHKFSEKKCREYLRYIDPSIEKLERNQGVIERRVTDLINDLSAS